jgi:hypothetical protein
VCAERAEAERVVRELEIALREQDGLVGDEAAKLLALAADFPRAFASAESAAVRRTLLGALVSRVWVRNLASRIDRVTLEFPSGHRIEERRRHRSARVHAARARVVLGQPARPVAFPGTGYADARAPHRRAGRRAPTTTARHLAAPLHRQRSGARARRGAPIRAPAAAEGAEGGSLAPRAPQTIAELAGIAGVEEADVLRVALNGRLGDAQADVAAGTIRLTPSNAELHAAFPKAGRAAVFRSVFAARGHAENEVIPLADAVARIGTTQPVVKAWAEEAGLLEPDDSGRYWTVSTLSVPSSVGSLEDAVAGLEARLGLSGIATADFVPISTAAREITALLGGSEKGRRLWLQREAVQSRWLSVLAAPEGKSSTWRPVRYVYLPPVIRALVDAGRVDAWLRGALEGVTAWTPPAARPSGQPGHGRPASGTGLDGRSD